MGGEKLWGIGGGGGNDRNVIYPGVSFRNRCFKEYKGVGANLAKKMVGVIVNISVFSISIIAFASGVLIFTKNAQKSRELELLISGRLVVYTCTLYSTL